MSNEGVKPRASRSHSYRLEFINGDGSREPCIAYCVPLVECERVSRTCVMRMATFEEINGRPPHPHEYHVNGNVARLAIECRSNIIAHLVAVNGRPVGVSAGRNNDIE